MCGRDREMPKINGPMNSSAKLPGQEPVDEVAWAQDDTAGSSVPGHEENSQREAAIGVTPSGDEMLPTASRPTDVESDGSVGADSAAEEPPPSLDEETDEETITDRLLGAVAERLRDELLHDRPSDARLAGRDYHEHRVVFNLTASGSDERVEIIGYELSRRTCTAIQNLFVKPDGYDEAHAKLGTQRLLFLSGRPQVGKGTAAKHLALSYAGVTGIEERPRKLVRLEPTTPLAALHRFEFKHMSLMDWCRGTRENSICSIWSWWSTVSSRRVHIWSSAWMTAVSRALSHARATSSTGIKRPTLRAWYGGTCSRRCVKCPNSERKRGHG
jgi:hypothetical protein